MNINIISIYASTKATIYEFEEMIKQITNFGEKTIIAGDFNSHHSYWGDEKMDSCGNTLLEGIEASSLIVLKNETYTNIPSDTTKRRTAIDLTIITQEIYVDTHKTILDQHIGNSQHRIIEISLNKSTTDGKTIVYSRGLQTTARGPHAALESL